MLMIFRAFSGLKTVRGTASAGKISNYRNLVFEIISRLYYLVSLPSIPVATVLCPSARWWCICDFSSKLSYPLVSGECAYFSVMHVQRSQRPGVSSISYVFWCYNDTRAYVFTPQAQPPWTLNYDGEPLSRQQGEILFASLPLPNSELLDYEGVTPANQLTSKVPTTGGGWAPDASERPSRVRPNTAPSSDVENRYAELVAKARETTGPPCIIEEYISSTWAQVPQGGWGKGNGRNILGLKSSSTS